MRQLAGCPAHILPCRHGGGFDPCLVPFGKCQAKIAQRRLVLGQARADFLDDPTAKIRRLVRAKQRHRPPIDQVPGNRFQSPLHPLPETGAIIDVLGADIGREGLSHYKFGFSARFKIASSAAVSSKTALTGRVRISRCASGGRRIMSFVVVIRRALCTSAHFLRSVRSDCV